MICDKFADELLLPNGLQYLNTNHNLYNAVMKAELEGSILNKETQRAANYLRVDFEKGGIHLSGGTFPVSS